MTTPTAIQNAIDLDPGLVEPEGFVRYDPATGEIMMAGTMPQTHIATHQDEGDPILAVPGIQTDQLFPFIEGHYVDLADHTVKAKEAFPGTLTGLVFTGLPVPSRIEVETPFQTGNGWWAPTIYPNEDADVELSFNVPDTYRVTVRSVKYQTAVFMVTL